MFSLPCPVDERPEGESETHPIVLTEVEVPDFDRFLAILYPACVCTYAMRMQSLIVLSRDLANCELTTMEEWTSVLSLASRWEFMSLHQLAIERLSSITSAVDKLIIGRQYDLPQWLLSAYTELCERREPLTLEEGRKLGVDDVVIISHVRHSIRHVSNFNRSHETIAELVKDVFHLHS